MQIRDPLALKKMALQKSLEKLQGLAPFPAGIVTDLELILNKEKEEDIETINKLRAKLKALLATEGNKTYSKATYDSTGILGEQISYTLSWGFLQLTKLDVK